MNPDNKINTPKPVSGQSLAKDLYEKLCTNLVIHLEKVFYKGKKLSDIGITIAERKKTDDSIKIVFNEDCGHDLYPMLRELEKHPDFRNRLAVMRNVIFIMQQEVAYDALVKTKGLINNFLSVFIEKVKDYGVNFALVTPLTVAVTTDPVKLQLEVNTPNGAIRLHNRTHIDWKARIEKEKNLSIEVPLADMEKYITETIRMIYPSKIVPGEQSQESLHRVIPFGKTWEATSVQSSEKGKAKGLHTYKIRTETSSAPVYGYVQESTDYDDFYFLYFNRKVNQKHVRSIMDSIEENGPMGFVTVAITNVIDGVMRKYIVDGQHRYWAYKKLGMPILFTFTYAESKRQLVKLIATLNNTSKSWTLKDYLNAWESVDSENYGTIKTLLGTTKLQITVLLEAFSGQNRKTATEKFQKGIFQIEDKDAGMRYVNYLADLKKHVSKSRNLYSALLAVFRQVEGYNNEIMIKKISESGVILNAGINETQEEIITRLSNLYCSKMTA